MGESGKIRWGYFQILSSHCGLPDAQFMDILPTHCVVNYFRTLHSIFIVFCILYFHIQEYGSHQPKESLDFFLVRFFSTSQAGGPLLKFSNGFFKLPEKTFSTQLSIFCKGVCCAETFNLPIQSFSLLLQSTKNTCTQNSV